jgi:hypothetical protein
VINKKLQHKICKSQEKIIKGWIFADYQQNSCQRAKSWLIDFSSIWKILINHPSIPAPKKPLIKLLFS